MDLTALLLLALVDSVNPSSLVVTLMLLARPGGTRAALPYVAGIYVSYLALGGVLVGGTDLAFERWGAHLEHPAAFVVESLLGLTLFVIAVRAPKEAPPPAERSLGRGTLGALFLLGATITAAELPTALPYLAATGLLGASDLGPAQVAAHLAIYCAIFVAPPLLLVMVQVVLGQRAAGPRFERLREKLRRGARETMLWLFGIVGFSLMTHGATELVFRFVL
ncbi:MAG: GAP family protein [Planctomycetota bacterium]